MTWRLRFDYARVIVMVMLVEVLVRLCSLSTAAKLLRIRSATERSSSAEPVLLPRDVWSARELRLARVTVVVIRKFYGESRGCLRRSLVLGWILRRRRPVLHLGVRRSVSGQIEAHAWLEFDDVQFESATEYAQISFLSEA